MIKSFIVLPLLIGSFFNVQDSSKMEELLIGVWVYDTTQNNKVTTYRKSKKFLNDKPGMEFKADGIIIFREQDHRGWCGTAPLAFEKYEGSWKVLDSTIFIKVKYSEGTTKQAWELISITPSILTIMHYGTISKK